MPTCIASHEPHALYRDDGRTWLHRYSAGYLVEVNGTLRYSSFGGVTWNSLSWADNDVRVRLSRADGTASSDVTVMLGNASQALTAILLAANYAGTSLKVWKAYRGALAGCF